MINAFFVGCLLYNPDNILLITDKNYINDMIMTHVTQNIQILYQHL